MCYKCCDYSVIILFTWYESAKTNKAVIISARGSSINHLQALGTSRHDRALMMKTNVDFPIMLEFVFANFNKAIKS